MSISDVELINNQKYIYGFYKTFFYGIESTDPPVFKQSFVEYRDCTQHATCAHYTCTIIRAFDSHYDSCHDELCNVCLPIRWLQLSRRVKIQEEWFLSMRNHTLDGVRIKRQCCLTDHSDSSSDDAGGVESPVQEGARQ